MRKLLLAASLLIIGCGSLHENYVKQDRNNYETLAPRIRKLMETSDYYSSEQEADIEDRLQSWDLWTFEGMEAIKKDE